MQPLAIVFDLDGTLADTEPLHIEVWLDIIEKEGLSFDEAWMHQWIGSSDRTIASYVCEHHLYQRKVEDLQHIKQVAYRSRAESEARLFPGVMDYLPAIRSLVPVGLATNSSRVDVDVIFRATGLHHYLDAVVTANDVQHMKPDPEPYARAARLLGIPASNCLALEDSPAGVHSARKAGLFTLAVTNSHTPAQLADADKILEDTPQALAFILSMLSS